MNIEHINTFAANAGHAARTGEAITVGGGKFDSKELASVATALKSFEGMTKALSEISALLKDHPDFAKGNSIVHYCAHKARSALGDAPLVGESGTSEQASA